MERVVESETRRRAWKRVKANRGAPGVEGMTLDAAHTWVRMHRPSVREFLLQGPYHPLPLRRTAIPTPSGGERVLGIPAGIDRVIQPARRQGLTPIVDPEVSASSFGVRPQRSAHGAVRQVQAFLRNGYRVAVEVDLEQVFDRVHHDGLMVRVARTGADTRVVALLGRSLRAGVMVDGVVHPTTWGPPQGGPVSPRLATILVDDLDTALERRGLRFARYADDRLILVKSRRAAERVKASITRYLTEVVHLSVNEQTSRVAPIHEGVCLGVTVRGTKLRWSDQAFADVRHRLTRLTDRRWGVAMEDRLGTLAQDLRGWMGDVGLSDSYRPIPELDHWRRRRVRMADWTPWRYARTTVRHLVALGTNRRQAIVTAISRTSSWHRSKTLATPSGMTTAWLHEPGRLSIRDLWMTVHGFA